MTISNDNSQILCPYCNKNIDNNIDVCICGYYFTSDNYQESQKDIEFSHSIPIRFITLFFLGIVPVGWITSTIFNGDFKGYLVIILVVLIICSFANFAVHYGKLIINRDGLRIRGFSNIPTLFWDEVVQIHLITVYKFGFVIKHSCLGFICKNGKEVEITIEEWDKPNIWLKKIAYENKQFLLVSAIQIYLNDGKINFGKVELDKNKLNILNIFGNLKIQIPFSDLESEMEITTNHLEFSRYGVSVPINKIKFYPIFKLLLDHLIKIDIIT